MKTATLWGFFTGRRLREMELDAAAVAERQARIDAVVRAAFRSLYSSSLPVRNCVSDQLDAARSTGVVLSNELDRINMIWRASYGEEVAA